MGQRSMPASRPGPWRRDRRLLGMILLGTLVVGVGFLVTLLPSRAISDRNSVRVQDAPARLTESWPGASATQRETYPAEEFQYEQLIAADVDPDAHARQMKSIGAQQSFEQSVAMLRAGQYEQAVAALQRVLDRQPDSIEAQVNMGYALLGLHRYQAAHDFFLGAVELQPGQANAYYGLGVALEELGDLEGALGAMRSYLHLTDETDPYAQAITRARAALWEWEARLGRGPWGETQGIPPGLTADDMRRDGMGVGMVLPQPDGTTRLQRRPAEHEQRR